ncbi:hypothetical protein FJTKL_10311 [Diaporthe vaccinii]|uniref:Uncharacterized protein n=1 Tax=Diaporthe vaccinii TaxID=105482 RepID=A0ABR4EL17_9PEZI
MLQRSDVRGNGGWPALAPRTVQPTQSIQPNPIQSHPNPTQPTSSLTRPPLPRALLCSALCSLFFRLGSLLPIAAAGQVSSICTYLPSSSSFPPVTWADFGQINSLLAV